MWLQNSASMIIIIIIISLKNANTTKVGTNFDDFSSDTGILDQ